MAGSDIGGFVIGVSPIGGPLFSENSPGLTQTIPSYLYWEYSDDSDLQAFIAAYNAMAQQYVNWFNQIGLPIYTNPNIFGVLLDWVAEGLYGLRRPALPSGTIRAVGPLNTWELNSIAFNTMRFVAPETFYATTDDVFKRIITWHFYKGDGKVFTIRWLKRRIMRFLEGTNGTAPNIDQTYQVSVSFGVGNQVNITILSGIRTFLSGAIFNGFAMNTQAFNAIQTSFVPLTNFALAPVLKAAIEAGACELPFQYTYVVSIGA